MADFRPGGLRRFSSRLAHTVPCVQGIRTPFLFRRRLTVHTANTANGYLSDWIYSFICMLTYFNENVNMLGKYFGIYGKILALSRTRVCHVQTHVFLLRKSFRGFL